MYFDRSNAPGIMGIGQGQYLAIMIGKAQSIWLMLGGVRGEPVTDID
jgi:hypothetical protein